MIIIYRHIIKKDKRPNICYIFEKEGTQEHHLSYSHTDLPESPDPPDSQDSPESPDPPKSPDSPESPDYQIHQNHQNHLIHQNRQMRLLCFIAKLGPV